MKKTDIVVDLLGVIVAVTKGAPRVLVVNSDDEIALPNGPFVPDDHASLEDGFRQLIETQAGLDLYYVEQLYTFGNRFRTALEIEGGPRTLSVAYVALTREDEAPLEGTRWANWYEFLPWEDWRNGRPDHFYAPYPGHASAPDFIEFMNHDLMLSLSELPDLYK